MKLSTNHVWLAVAVVGLVAALVVLTEQAKTPEQGPSPPPRPAARRLPPPRIGYVETPPIHIDRIYSSMEGPSERIVVNTSEIDWIMAFKTEVIDTATNQPMGEELSICLTKVGWINCIPAPKMNWRERSSPARRERFLTPSFHLMASG